MSGVRLLFDENFGKPLVTAISAVTSFYDPSPTLRHLLDFAEGTGQPDDVWIPRLAQEGPWIVVSADAGHLGGPKLPLICERERITHLLISGRLHKARQFEKARAIIALWPEIVATANSPRGSRFKIHYAQTRLVLTPK